MNRLKDTWVRVKKAWALAPHIDDLHAAFEERRGSALSAHERELLENALAFSQIVADDVSVPRAAIVALAEGSDLDDTLRLFAETSHSRLPVMGKNLDDIKGFVLLKDVVGKAHQLEGSGREFALADVTRTLPIVPESMDLTRVLQVMRRARVTMVLVVDEFGGTSGLICLRDILEELVGDLMDEQSEARSSKLVTLAPGRYFARGEVLLEDFDALAGTRLDEEFGEDVESIGGAVLHAANKVPAKGERVMLRDGVEALVTMTDGRRVLGVEVKVGA